LLDQALDVGKRLGDHVEQDKLFQAIAIYASHSGDFKTAEHYAKLAYIDAERIEDPERIVDAACTLAIVYRFDLRFSNADYYIRRAISKETSKIPNIRFATLFYENGTYYYRRDKFEQSLREYQHALDIFEEHGVVYQIAMTQQAMAQSHIFLKNFAKAESLLQAARSTWETLDNRYEWVNSTFVEGDLELQRGNHAEGIKLLRRAIDQANSVLPDTPARDLLIDQIKEHIENNP
jgi:tetratricopeptide (TPR) repeat protein